MSFDSNEKIMKFYLIFIRVQIKLTHVAQQDMSSLLALHYKKGKKGISQIFNETV